MLNNVNLQGRFTADPDLRITQSNITMARFSLANDAGYADSKGNKVVNFVPCVAWKNTAEVIEKYFHKGDLAIVEGSLSTRTYEKDGVRQYITEINVNRIHFCESKKRSSEVESNDNSFEPKEQSDTDSKMATEIDNMHDADLPF